MKSYSKYIDKYKSIACTNKKLNCCSLNVVLTEMLKCKDIESAIEKACMSRFQNKKHPHQQRIPDEILKIFSKRIKKYSKEIENIKNFQGIFDFIKNIGSKIAGIGELAIYDVSLRIAFYRTSKLGKSILPKKVYLHRGALIGAKKILKNIPKDKIVEVQSFPPEFQVLEAYEIEDFLCIYKDEF